jgi:hypothetical protein
LAADGFVITAGSESGTTFTITKANGALVKPYTCSDADTGGCNANGEW